ncbi:MAG: SH3 domain-containing protein, partial [Gemmatimonadota bacterium]|nr:SH3 domain-containing protein [Gemmatimonadota bacterium]
LAFVALGVGGTLRALVAGTPAQDFRAGVEAYGQHAYVAARDAFARVAAAEPRAADAWANFGTAAWAARDTAGAVVGWRRALGLEPLADDARDRLGLVHGVPAMAPGYVPPAPIDLLLLVMALAWIAVCAAWHPAVRDRTPAAPRLIVPAVVVAALFGLAAIALSGRLDGRRLAVVRGPAMLSTDPGFGAGVGSDVETGEIVRVLSQQGAWMRVEVDGGRQGWLPAQQLVALDAPLPSPLD